MSSYAQMQMHAALGTPKALKPGGRLKGRGRWLRRRGTLAVIKADSGGTERADGASAADE